MRKFSWRSEEPEIMDDLTCAGEAVNQTLREIDTINRWLGGNSITLEGVERLLLKRGNALEKLTVADIGCGSGEILKLISLVLKQKKIPMVLTGFDANPNIIAYAEQHSKEFREITFVTENILQQTFRDKKFDIITATLFLHHFTTHQLIELLKALKHQSRLGLVINDLHRHPLAYYAIKFLTTLFSKSAMVKYDAPLSVLRGFTRKEWKEILCRAGINHYSLTWKWAFRWQLIIFGPSYSEMDL
jgi:2-polyprenyl-3-methyl-5-hydroxy-6-metoxy-1,4-benzoquinol methylase